MEFEYDPEKSRSNRTKHGIDFIEAQRLWERPVVEIESPRPPEMRYLCIGVIDGNHWSAIITYAGSRRRIISVRQSNENEINHYASKTAPRRR